MSAPLTTVVITTQCEATVTETWTIQLEALPDGFEDMEIHELIDLSVDFSVRDEVDDERDRETLSVEVDGEVVR